MNNKYRGCSECHIEQDWLLIYKKSEKDFVLVLLDTGSHSEDLDK